LIFSNHNCMCFYNFAHIHSTSRESYSLQFVNMNISPGDQAHSSPLHNFLQTCVTYFLD
jgi:hypothetical protein